MITKKQFCEYVLDKYRRDYGYPEGSILPESAIQDSSSVAVAMEYLGLLKEQYSKDYAACRGGLHILVDSKNPSILSTREMIELLPETLS